MEYGWFKDTADTNEEVVETEDAYLTIHVTHSRPLASVIIKYAIVGQKNYSELWEFTEEARRFGDLKC